MMFKVNILYQTEKLVVLYIILHIEANKIICNMVLYTKWVSLCYFVFIYFG